MFYQVRPMLSRLLLVFCLSTSSFMASAQAPTAVDDSYSVNVNGMLTVPAASGLLSNDTGFNAATHRLESTSVVSQYGARLTIGADGAFSYDPPAGFSGIDTFAYTVRSAGGAAAAVVSVDVAGQTVWFVDDSAAAGGDGSFGAPFNSLSLVNGANGVGDVDAAGETIFVYAGNYSVEFDVETGQQLLGESNGLDLIGTGNDIPAGARPTLTGPGTFPVIEFFGLGGSARGFDINLASGTGLQGASVSNVTVVDVAITMSAGATNAVLFNGIAGTNNLNNVDITGAAGSTNSALLLLNNSGTTSFVDSSVSGFTGGYVLNVNGNSGTISFDSTSDLASSNTRGLTIQTQTATGVVNLAGVNLAGGAASEPLIRLQSNHLASTVNFAEGVVAAATTADSAAFLSDGGRLRIAGSSTLSATDGAALYLESVELTQNATFASLTSTSSQARGISIDSPVGNNDVIVSGTTTVNSPTTEAVRVSSPAASGFALLLATLNSTGGTVGIDITNAAVGVTNNASTLTTSAGPAVRCTAATTNLALATLTAAGGANGVSFDGCGGTVTAATGVLNSTAGAANASVNLIGSSATNNLNFTYGGNVPKNTAGAAVNIASLTSPGAVTFNGSVSGTNASSGVSITNSSRSVTFTTLILGDAANRFATTPVTLAGNTGAVDLGVLSVFTNGATALNINYANASPGQITTDAGSLLNVAGAARALVVSHATSQTLSLQFTDIINTGAGTHGIDINRATGALVVTGLVNLGAKTTAGVQISNSNNLVVSIDELDITGAADGVRLSDNTGGSFTILGDGNFISSHTNGAGGTFTNLTDNAFDLSNVVDFRATDVTVNGTGSHGVTGGGITGTTIFSNVDFSNIGNADNEHVFNLQEGAVSGAQVSGTFEINNSVIENFTDNGMYLENFAGTLNFIFTNNVLRNNLTTTACGGGNCNGNGILLRADGTSRINAFILNSAFEDIDGIALTANPEGSSGARMDINVVQSAFTAEPYGGPSHTNNGETAISLRNAQGNSTLNFRLFSNDIRNYSGEFALGVVEIEGGDFTTTQGVIDTLYVYHAHLGNAVQIFADGANTAGSGTTNFGMNVSMNGINVPAVTPIFGASILLQNNGAISGSTVNSNYIVTNSNLLANATGTARRTLTMNVRDFNNACSDIRSNTIAAGTGGTQPSVNLSYNGSGNVRLQGMAGSGDANAISYLGANNTLSVAASSGTNNNITSATCTVPALPVAFPFN